MKDGEEVLSLIQAAIFVKIVQDTHFSCPNQLSPPPPLPQLGKFFIPLPLQSWVFYGALTDPAIKITSNAGNGNQFNPTNALSNVLTDASAHSGPTVGLDSMA